MVRERSVHNLGLACFNEFRLNGQVSNQQDTIYIHKADFRSSFSKLEESKLRLHMLLYIELKINTTLFYNVLH